MAKQSTAKKITTKELDWLEMNAHETVAVGPGGIQLRVKRSSGPTGVFYYCYHGPRYVGVEHDFECAKARTAIGLIRVTAEELPDWLKLHSTTLPPVLLASERARLKRWVDDAPRRAALPPEPNPADHKTVNNRGAPKGGRVGKAGKIPPGAVYHFVKKVNPYKPGTERAAMAAIAMEKDGKRVADALAAGAPPWVFRIMLSAGIITIEKMEDDDD